MNRIDFENTYDVIVVGGGIAGVAAAVAASECGARTALIEKTAWFGGMATTGSIYFYLPICDGNGHQVSFGLCEKLLKASVKYGPSSLNPRWQEPDSAGPGIYDRCRTTFSPASFVLAMDEMLENAEVEIWLDTVLTGYQRQDGMGQVCVRNKGGNGLLAAPVVVDATGDAEVIREAGGAVKNGENQLAFWGLEHCDPNPKTEEWFTLNGSLRGVIKGIIDKEPVAYHQTEPRGVTEFLLQSRRWLRGMYAGPVQKQTCFPVLLPGIPQFRTVSSMRGKFVIPENMHNTKFEDSIGMASDWSSINTIQEIPYRALLPEKVPGILAAGRCISADDYAWELIRSIPACAVSGEAAGVAAAMSAQKKIDPSELSVQELQTLLRKRDCRLSLHEAGLLYRDEPGARPFTLKKNMH